MSIFSTLMDKIFHHSTAQATTGAQASTGAGAAPASASAAPQSVGASPPSGQPKLQAVDVEAVLTKLAAGKGGGGNWRTSIVDLLKLLDLDSSLAARKELANELNVHVGADGSAEQNIALQKAVMTKLAENGGKVPESLRH
jgi:PPE-repeat protein